MNIMKQLEAIKLPLSSSAIIEAAAGTGKTHNITTLYLRLLLEEAFTVDRILVVTYTRAATAELRSRIRGRLRKALAAYSEGADCGDDDVLAGIRPDDIRTRQVYTTRLFAALKNFDEAAVFTIHAFCSTLLRENAFESGVSFDAEMLDDNRELVREIVADFWRQRMQECSPLFAAFCADHGFGFDHFFSLAVKYAGQEHLKVVCAMFPGGNETPEKEFGRLTERLRNQCGSLETFLRDQYEQGAFNRNKLRLGSFEKNIEELTALCAGKNSSEAFFSARGLLRKFFSETLRYQSRNGTLPDHPAVTAVDLISTAAEELEKRYEASVSVMRREAIEYVWAESAARKRMLNVQFYDDFLTQIHRALTGKNGARLRAAIRSRYPAALIDEFQDTDELQYRIFREIYSGKSDPFFMIGDPKQSIYRFRGADIFSYISARRTTGGNAYTLGTNYRSVPRLITAFNALFSNELQPFMFGDYIPYHEVKPAPAKHAATKRLTEKEVETPAISLWFIRRPSDDNKKNNAVKPMSKEAARRIVSDAVASEIVRITDPANAVCIDGNQLKTGQIAILVSSHSQGEVIRRALQEKGVPHVSCGQRSVYSSDEAVWLERLLNAVAFPEDDAALRAVCVGPFFRIEASSLDLPDDARDEQWRELLRRCRDLWLRRGFMQMIRMILDTQGAAVRILGRPGGERSMTNLRHLAELIKKAAVERRLGIVDTIALLGRRRAEAETAIASEEELLRLESDGERVRIITVHKSKGLQFPVVFSPFAWDGRLWEGRDEMCDSHDPADNYRRVLDFGSDRAGELRKQAGREERAEALRKLYVAVTRAQYRCYLACGAITDYQTSALAYLLHQRSAEGDDRVSRVEENVLASTDTDLMEDIDDLCRRSGGAIIRTSPPVGNGMFRAVNDNASRSLSCRTPLPAVPETWCMTSYSSLAAGGALPHAVEQADYDDHEVGATGEEAAAGTPFALPRGTLTGTMIHEIFERIDFQASPESTGDTVRQVRAQYGFEQAHDDVLIQIVRDTLAAPLRDGCSLGKVSSSERLNELEFFYPLERHGRGTEHIIGSGHGNSLYESAFSGFPPDGISGFMKGFIDLVFRYNGRYYIVDYKSNYLGPDGRFYDAESLRAAMISSNYVLQYCIYTLAVNRFLKTRVTGYSYDRHFGGVYYLFLRGMDGDTETGIFFDRPPESLVQALSAWCEGGAP